MRAFHGVVIYEYERIQADIEKAGDSLQIDRLRIPVDEPRGKVRRSQHHVGMRLQDLQRDLFIVLARDGQENAPRAQSFKKYLNIPEHVPGIVVPDLDALGPVISNDATPE